jgi:L-asparaginase
MKILFIQTGGTIDKDYAKGANVYNFEIADPAVKRILESVNPSFEYEIVTIAKKDSQDLNEQDRDNILKACQNSPETHIIITHGSDTMDITAKILTTIENKIIVITGSSRPERFSDSDASFNIGTAIGALYNLRPGIYIAMHGLVLPWDKIHKNPQTGQF